MQKTKVYPGLAPWLEDIGQSQRWLMRELGETDPAKINARATWRRDIPKEWEPKLRQLGYNGPLKRNDIEAPDGGSLERGIDRLNGLMAERFENLKGYVDAHFKGAHVERETLAEILRAMAERQDEIAVKLGLPSLIPSSSGRKKGG